MYGVDGKGEGRREGMEVLKGGREVRMKGEGRQRYGDGDGRREGEKGN